MITEEKEFEAVIEIKAIIKSQMAAAQDLLDYQADKMNWETFKFKCLQRHYEFNNGEISTSYAEWFDFHKKNNTHKCSNTSSRSLFEGLTDSKEFQIEVYDLTDETAKVVYDFHKQEKSKLNIK